ncbi:MAG TPA: peptide-N4-asparagine amidase [Candidatus Bathyarchaeia archaeon]|nr:peptide-N4-asparagine amidase [Candidatus Bathyarchaeia archaeon]
MGQEEGSFPEHLFDEDYRLRAKKTLTIATYVVLLFPVVSVGYDLTAPLLTGTLPTVLTAEPPIRRPGTQSCKLILLENQTFASGVNQPFFGHYAPPTSCQPPWSMIVLDWNGTVPISQYDHVGGVWVGPSEIFRFTTPETGGQRWHVEKDVSEYAGLLAQNQTVKILISAPSGKMFASASLTFYLTNSVNPVISHPTIIVGVVNSGPIPWFGIGRDALASQNISLPVNIEKAYFELYATAHSCDETWFSSNLVPNTSCSGPNSRESFREIQILIDETLVGVIWPFPLIYMGGLGSDLWESIPPVNALNIPPYLIDLTPFIGILGDGKAHGLAIQVTNNHGYWLVDGNLLLSLDSSNRTTGKLVNYSIARSATLEVAPLWPFETSANRKINISGYVNTSTGQITTEVQQNMFFNDNLVPNILDLSADLMANVVVTTTTTIIAPNGTTFRTAIDSYGVTIREGLPAKSGPVGILTTYTVDQVSAHTSKTNTGSNDLSQTYVVDIIHAEHAGLTSEHYVANRNVCSNHYIGVLLGSITSDVNSTVCPKIAASVSLQILPIVG